VRTSYRDAPKSSTHIPTVTHLHTRTTTEHGPSRHGVTPQPPESTKRPPNRPFASYHGRASRMRMPPRNTPSVSRR